jgi:phage protein D
MGYKDAVEEVAIYEITGERAFFNSEGGVSVTLEGHCHLQRLNHAKVNRGYNEKNIADIVSEIAGLYSLSSETDVQSEPAPFTLQRNQTDFEYLLTKTLEHNCYLWGNDKTVYFKKDTDTGKEEVVLEKGKTLTAFSGGAQSGKLYTSVVVRGRNKDTGVFIEAIAGPDKIKKKIGGDTAAPTHIEKNLAKHKHYYFDYGIKDIKGAEERAALILYQNSMDYVRFTGECQGNPKVLAGMTINIKGMGEIYSGKYLVTQAEHELIPLQGYMTSFEVVRNATLARKGKKQWVSATTVPAKKKAKGKLKPEFSNLQWLDKDEKNITEASVDETVICTADVKNVSKGEAVSIKIYDKDEGNNCLNADSIQASDGVIKYNWKVTCDKAKLNDDSETGFVFKLSSGSNTESDKSEELLLNKNKLIVQLGINPNDSETQDDKYTLYSTDDSKKYKQVLTVKDDKVPGDKLLDLHFTGIKTDLNYTLEIDPGMEGSPYNLFEDIPYEELVGNFPLNKGKVSYYGRN